MVEWWRGGRDVATPQTAFDVRAVSVTRTKITMVIYSSLSRAAFVKLLLLLTDPAWVSNGVW